MIQASVAQIRSVESTVGESAKIVDKLGKRSQEIGQIVGCSRETVGRILKMLEDQSLISAHGKTIVVFGTR